MSYKLLDEDEYELDDYYNDKYFYRRKQMQNTTSRNNRNRMVYKNNLTELPVDVAEAIASAIGKKTIENVCDCELTKKKRIGVNKFDHGVVSYYYYSDNDKLIHPSEFIKEYLNWNGMSTECVDKKCVSIDICIKSIFYYLKVVLQRPYKECQKVRQQFIDMIMFDCRYGNYDRNIDNWMLYQNKDNGEVELYPAFDNECFLGFDEYLSKFQVPENIAKDLSKTELSKLEKQLVLDYNATLKMKEIIPEDEKKSYSNYEDIVKYLLSNYPEHTLEAYKKLNRFSYYDLVALLDEMPIPEERKLVVKKIFVSRELAFHRLVMEKLNNDMDSKPRY